MTARQDLKRAIGSAARDITASEVADIPVLDLPTLWVDLPAFGGRCRLIPHSPETPPGGAMTLAYINAGGCEKTLNPAFYCNGGWIGRNLKPLGRPVRVWYHIERPDND